MWDIRSSEMDPLPTLELFDLETPVQALAIDGTGKALAAAGEDGMVAVWDMATGALLATSVSVSLSCSTFPFIPFGLMSRHKPCS